MALLPPAVVGPLSECSSSVRVQGQLIGATVDIYSNNVHVANGVATWTDQVFPLSPGQTLPPGHDVTRCRRSRTSRARSLPRPSPCRRNLPRLDPSRQRHTFLYAASVSGSMAWSRERRSRSPSAASFVARESQLSGNALALAMIGGNPNQSPQAFAGEGGTTPNVSSNGQNAGTGVVWAIARTNSLRVLEFDATNLTHQLLDVDCGPWTNSNGSAFIEPTMIQGKVYVAGGGELTVFGL